MAVRGNVGCVVAVYALALVVGIVFAVPFAIGARRLRPPRRVVAALLGFGLGGMSASFAGWSTALAFIGAISGGGAIALAASYLVPADAGGGGE